MSERGIVLTPYLIGLLVLGIALMGWRLAVVTGQRNVLQVEKTERERRDAMRDVANARNKERTDEEHTAAKSRAARVVVRLNGPGIKPKPAAVAASGNEALVCYDRGRLGAELDGWSERTAGRLTELLRRHAGGLEAIARAGEGVAADYRACAAWALSAQ